MKRFRYGGGIDYPGVGEISDKDVHKVIMDHSRLIDRMSSTKMVEMTLLAQCILMRLWDNIDPNDKTWKFYGKHSIQERDEAWA